MYEPRQLARRLQEANTITLERLWIRYWGEGGNAGPLELDAYVHEALRAHPFELVLMTWAMEGLNDSLR